MDTGRKWRSHVVFSQTPSRMGVLLSTTFVEQLDICSKFAVRDASLCVYLNKSITLSG